MKLTLLLLLTAFSITSYSMNLEPRERLPVITVAPEKILDTKMKYDIHYSNTIACGYTEARYVIKSKRVWRKYNRKNKK